jgi:hypothetical protein
MGEYVKVGQALLRRASRKVTMDVYAQALTQAKGAAQRKVVTIAKLLYKQCMTSSTCLFLLPPYNDPPISADERRCSACGSDTPESSVSSQVVPRHRLARR